MYLCTRRKIWTSFSCLVLLKCYHVVFSQFKFPANLAQLVVPKMYCLYANAVVQPSMQHHSCYMAWKTKVHTWCRHCHLCINAPTWREKRWLQELFYPPSYMLNWYFKRNGPSPFLALQLTYNVPANALRVSAWSLSKHAIFIYLFFNT